MLLGSEVEAVRHDHFRRILKDEEEVLMTSDLIIRSEDLEKKNKLSPGAHCSRSVAMTRFSLRSRYRSLLVQMLEEVVPAMTSQLGSPSPPS